MRRVRLSANAETDLLSILDYLAAENASVALRTVQRLQGACSELSDRALQYPLLPGREETGVHRRVVGNYGVYYLVEQDYVHVLQILHAARDHERILFPED